MNDQFSEDWRKVTHCPLCGAPYSDVSTTVNIPATGVFAMSVSDLAFPVAFSVVYNECAWCGMIYQNPTLTDVGAEKFYKAGGVYRTVTQTTTNYEVEIARSERLIQFVRQMDAKSILDIGCGHGELLKMCQDDGMDVQGTDMTPDHCIEGIPACYSLAELGGKKYDIVSMIHVLEHVPNPVEFLREAAGHSKKWVLVEVPKYDIGDYTVRYLNLPHVLIFRTWTMVSTMQAAGIAVEGLGTFQRNMFAFGKVKGR